MPPRAWKILSAVSFSLMQASAVAQDGPECFSRHTKTNVCEHARNAQAQIVSSLPMKVSNNLTLVSAMALGPKLLINASFGMTKASAEKLAIERGSTMAAWTENVIGYTRNSVCGDKILAAFVRLGGRMQYIYKTLDGFEDFQSGSLKLRPYIISC